MNVHIYVATVLLLILIVVNTCIASMNFQEHFSKPILSVAIFGCLTVPKYRQQIEDCWHTWVRLAIKKGIEVKFFVGAIPNDIPGPLRSHCVKLDCGDDYFSSTCKHWRGLQYMYTHHPAAFYYTCGTDTFLHAGNALKLLEEYDPLAALYIGGHGDTRKIDGEEYYFHSGGPGYIFSHAAMGRINSNIDKYYPSFYDAYMDTLVFCDVQSGYVAHQLGIKVVKVENKFWHCDMNGYPCHIGQVDKRTLVACHLMSGEAMKTYAQEIDTFNL